MTRQARGRRTYGAFLLLCVWLALDPAPLRGQQAAPLDRAILQIISRPVFRHTRFGIEFYSLDTNQPVYNLNPEMLFTPASTTKLLTEGAALELLGPDYRFHTRVYRAGPIDSKGTLKGDLIVVASGDPNLSQRIQPDDTLAFENDDHGYGGVAVPGDPLSVIKELAQQVAAHGIKAFSGRVLVDTSLFPEGAKEPGTGVIISPIAVNDNVVDVTASPGSSVGAPVALSASPGTGYVRFVSQATTGPAGSEPTIDWSKDEAGPDGSHTVTVTGTMPLGKPAALFPYPVPQPSRFAEFALVEALHERGIVVSADGGGAPPDFKALAAWYTPANLVAEHVSPPLSEDAKVTLKVSQNLHASLMPYLLGAVLDHATTSPDQAGFDLERGFLEKGQLDLGGASQSDGEGGARADFFTPDFMVHYLAYMRRQDVFPKFFAGLPVLGRDGTLANIQKDSPAAGHVFAKTGTWDDTDELNRDDMVVGKGLAGYLTTPDGRHLAFAIYANEVAVPKGDDWADKIVGQALGEIAAAAYLAPIAGNANAEARGSSHGIARPVRIAASSPSDRGGTAERRVRTSRGGRAAAEPGADPSVSTTYDVLIKGGRVIDGAGNPWFKADVAIQGDRIEAIGKLTGAKARRVIDASGLVVSPGFIDMLGQSEWALLTDNRALSKLSQGITTEITGEGGSIAPQNDLTLPPLKPFLDHYHLTVNWTTLEGYFHRLEQAGTPLNIGTYVGAAQVREAVLGDVDRAPAPSELARMEDLVAQAMQQGALGLSTALIYPPGSYAKTDELIALAKVASRYGGIYATHLRSEGATETAAIEEAFRIGRGADLPVEIFHLKASGKSRWGSMPKIVAMIDAARRGGLDVAADMYPYTAGATSLASCLPPWVANGGRGKMLERLRDPAVRKRITAEMSRDHPDWENLYYDSGGATGVLISSVVNPQLKRFEGKTLAQAARMEGRPPLEGMFDLILADHAQTGALYFLASEKDLEYGLKQPWTSIGLDAEETNLDGPLYQPHDHPRAWGAMPRFLGYYVREKRLLALEDAIRKITSLPADRERLAGRGLLKPGFYADITIFDPAKIKDKATYLRPASLSEGIDDVLVNGQLEFAGGRLTGVKAGRPLKRQ